MLENRKGWYQGNGIDYHQPWLVLMTDGRPADPPETIVKAATRIAEMVNARKLTVFATGAIADLDALRAFTA